MYFYILFLTICVWTLANLPFINLDASFRLTMWLRELERKLEKKLRDLD